MRVFYRPNTPKTPAIEKPAGRSALQQIQKGKERGVYRLILSSCHDKEVLAAGLETML
jgi:hypothetical protein